MTKSKPLVSFDFVPAEMEYTDAPQTATTDTMPCPRCGHILPKDAERCDRCDWTRHNETVSAEPQASDAIAALLSFIPGLGYVYKGHKMIGLLFIFIVSPLVFFFAFLAAIASAGFGFGLFFLYWAGVAIHAYAAEDKITPGADPGEQY